MIDDFPDELPEDTQRLPPSNNPAELAIIGSALLYGDRCLSNAAGIRVDEFLLPYHRDAWHAIRMAETRGSGLVDIVAVGAEVKALGAEQRFPGGWLLWASAAAQAGCLPDNVPAYVTMVRECAAARRLIDLCVEVQNMAYASQTFSECIEVARNGIADLETFGSKSQTVHVSDAITKCTDEIQKRMNGQSVPTISTGIPTLDQVLEGLEGGQLVIVAARPGMGKTALACNVAAINGLRGVPALIFSLEMRMKKLARRILIWSTEMNGKALHKPDLDGWKKITNAAGEFEKSKLWLNDRATKLGEIVSEARRWHTRNVQGNEDKRGIIFVDYAQLVTVAVAKGENREQVVAKISKTMKGLAKYLDVPVVLLAQLNRECEKRGGAPIVADLRESGALEQDADIILFPYRSVSADDPNSKNLEGPADIIVAKNRDGAIGSAPVMWTPELMTFWCEERFATEPPNFHEPRFTRSAGSSTLERKSLTLANSKLIVRG
jgi:replicative DNA helicase